MNLAEPLKERAEGTSLTVLSGLRPFRFTGSDRTLPLTRQVDKLH
jgi:hypothetical protein